MKKLLAFVLIILPLGSFASIITFKCKSTEVPGVHKFDASGVIAIDEQNSVEGVVSLQVEKAQAPGSIQIFEEIKVEGFRTHFEAGNMTSKPFDELTLKSADSYIKTFNLLLDFKGQNASQVFTVDNFLYRSNCIIESTK